MRHQSQFQMLILPLVEARRIGITEAQFLQDYSHISAADLVNAWVYTDASLEEIETAIGANEVA